MWVAIVDDKGDAVAEIKANGNNLGLVATSMFIRNGQVREDGNKRLYLDRNITITPTVQPTSPIDIRLYIKETEFAAFKGALNSFGQSANINTINDLGIYRNGDSCSAIMVRNANPVLTTAQRWEANHVLSGSTTALGSFYFFSTAQGGPLPVTSLEFSGKLADQNGELSWTTVDEYKTASFDLERSTNGTEYTKISSSVAVNQLGEHKYYYADKGITNLGVANIYYRVKQVDIDGKFRFSNVVVLTVKAGMEMNLYPNPVAHQANISISGAKAETVQVKLVDNAGRTIRIEQRKLTTGNNSFTWEVTGLASGIYHLQVTGQSFSERKTFIKK